MPKTQTARDRDDVHAALKDVGASLHDRFDADPSAVDRLAQLDSHLATVGMVVDHLYDEAERRLAQ